jgi:hypothetical protein
MKDDITQSDGFADGMLLASAASYPVVRGAAGMVGGVLDEARRAALVGRGAQLTRSASEFIPLVRPHLEAIDRALQQLGINGARRSLHMVMAALEDRVRWFSPAHIKEFVEANPVMPGRLYNELGEFLAAPIREAIDAIRQQIDIENSTKIHRQLRELERVLIRFAAEEFQADISRVHESSHLMRAWWVKVARIGTILLLGAAALLALAFFLR